MPWHTFKKGHDYRLDYVVATIYDHIESGKVKEKERKSEYLQMIRDSGHQFIRYSPIGEAWGNSPMYPLNWTTPDGRPICNVTSVPKSRGA